MAKFIVLNRLENTYDATTGVYNGHEKGDRVAVNIDQIAYVSIEEWLKDSPFTQITFTSRDQIRVYEEFGLVDHIISEALRSK